MAIPLAIDPTTRRPGVGFTINLRGRPSSPGRALLRALLIASKGTGLGTITADAELEEAVSGELRVAEILGEGTPGHLASKGLFGVHRTAQLDVLAPTEASGDAATGTVTFDDASAVTKAQTVTVYVAGRAVQIVWYAGETDIVAATRFVAKVESMSADLPVTAANGGGTLAVATLTFKQKGLIGNDCLISKTVAGGAGGSVALSGAALSGGTTEPSLVAALDFVKGREWDLIIACFSNADAADTASTTSGPQRLKTHIETYGEGIDAHLQKAIYARTGTLSATLAGAGKQNFGLFCVPLWRDALSLPCEVAGAIAGLLLKRFQVRTTYNTIGEVLPAAANLHGPTNKDASALSPSEYESALFGGVSVLETTSDGSCRVSRLITTYSADDNDNPDDRILDITKPWGLHFVAKDIRAWIPAQFPNVNVIPDQKSGAEDLPEGVVEIREVRTKTIGRLREHQRKGVILGSELDAAIADGSFVVQIDPDDDTQVDFLLPLKIIKPTAKWSVAVEGLS